MKNDLDFSEINDFEPIGGFQSTSFKGTFDGCGHTISNINIIPQIYSKNSVGLFANLDGATIKNLNIKNFSTYLPNGTYYIGESKVGALAGNANNSIVENVTCENILVGSSVFYNPSAKAYLGGLVGYITGESKISHCCIKGNNNNIIFRNYNTKSIETSHVGGLVGYSEADIESCYVECNISVNRIRNYLAETNYTKQYFGGLIGKNSGNVTQSYAVGSFDVSNCYQFFYFGGLVGYNTGLISNTFNNFILVHVEDITNAWSLVRSESIVGSVLAYDTNEFENVENNYYISNFDNFIFNKTNTGIRIEDKALLNNETYMQETLMFTDEIWNFNTTYPSFD